MEPVSSAPLKTTVVPDSFNQWSVVLFSMSSDPLSDLLQYRRYPLVYNWRLFSIAMMRLVGPYTGSYWVNMARDMEKHCWQCVVKCN